MEFEPKNELGKSRAAVILAGILGGLIVVSTAWLAVYALVIIPRHNAQRSAQLATMVAQDTEMNQTLTAIAVAPTFTGTPMPFFQYTIDLYGLNLKLPMGWMIQETNRRPELSGIESLAMGHDCADYVVTNPEGSAHLAIYPSCEASSGSPVICPSDAVSVAHSDASQIIVRYFDDKRGAYLYTNAFAGTASASGEKTMTCYDHPRLVIGDVFLRTEFQYVGIETGKEAMLKLIDQIVLSLEKR